MKTSITNDKIKTINKPKFLPSLGGILVWLVLWQIAAMKIDMALLLPSPISVLYRLSQLCVTADFWDTVLYSLLRILAGFFCGLIFGTFLAWFAWYSKIAQAMISPLIGALKAIPVASFIILALVWVQTPYLAAVVSFIMVVPMVYHNIRAGLDAADPELLEMAQMFCLSRWKKFRHIYLPALLPFFLSAVSSALGFAWKSGIAAEVLGKPARAIGKQISDAKTYLEMPDLFAWTLVVVILSILLEKIAVGIVGRIGRKRA